jgi:hypothetical protein
LGVFRGEDFAANEAIRPLIGLKEWICVQNASLLLPKVRA